MLSSQKLQAPPSLSSSQPFHSHVGKLALGTARKFKIELLNRSMDPVCDQGVPKSETLTNNDNNNNNNNNNPHSFGKLRRLPLTKSVFDMSKTCVDGKRESLTRLTEAADIWLAYSEHGRLENSLSPQTESQLPKQLDDSKSESCNIANNSLRRIEICDTLEQGTLILKTANNELENFSEAVTNCKLDMTEASLETVKGTSQVKKLAKVDSSTQTDLNGELPRKKRKRLKGKTNRTDLTNGTKAHEGIQTEPLLLSLSSRLPLGQVNGRITYFQQPTEMSLAKTKLDGLDSQIHFQCCSLPNEDCGAAVQLSNGIHASSDELRDSGNGYKVSYNESRSNIGPFPSLEQQQKLSGEEMAPIHNGSEVYMRNEGPSSSTGQKN